jgi:hypothetical protein
MLESTYFGYHGRVLSHKFDLVTRNRFPQFYFDRKSFLIAWDVIIILVII